MTDTFAPSTTWAVTAMAHPRLREVNGDCAECLTLVPSAIANALATGSRGCTYSDDDHSVTVLRAYAVVDQDDEGVPTPGIKDKTCLLRLGPDQVCGLPAVVSMTYHIGRSSHGAEAYACSQGHAKDLSDGLRDVGFTVEV